MELNLNVILSIVKGVIFFVFFFGIALYAFGDKTFHPHLNFKDFLIPASLFWMFGAIAASITNNSDIILMALLYSPEGNFSDDVSLGFFAAAYALIIIAVFRLLRKKLSKKTR